MLRSLKTIVNYKLSAVDGDIGKVRDFFFDDSAWYVRYLVADTGGWLPGRKVLLGPEALGAADWDDHRLPVSLTKDQIKNAPHVSSDAPVSRVQEERLRAYYDWPSWWATPQHGVLPMPVADVQDPDTVQGDPHLRSLQEILGYRLRATDEAVGSVDDVIVDDVDWRIRYLVVDLGEVMRGKRVLLAPSWTKEFRWADAELLLDTSARQVREAPAYRSGQAVNREYELRLYDYHGREVR